MNSENMLLEVKNLCVSFFTDTGEIQAVRDVSFSLDEGSILGIVGESGSGKTVTALSILRLLPVAGKIIGGSIKYKGKELLSLSQRQIRQVRGGEIGLIFQEPATSLNPVFTVGFQIIEALRFHQQLSRKQALNKAVELLESVGIDSASKRIKNYPHQLSGGQRQRVMIAMALSCSPSLLIADEPTTALDVTIQAQILDLLSSIQKERKMAVILITHDFGIISQFVDNIAVMRQGKIVEQAPTDVLLKNPEHFYIKELLSAGDGKDGCMREIFSVRNLSKRFILPCGFFRPAGIVRAVEEVTFTVEQGETLGIVGESGCGKSTLAKLTAGLLAPDSGEIVFDGGKRDIQLIFQDPYASLNPRMTVGEIIGEGLVVNKIVPRSQVLNKVQEFLEIVGLNRDVAVRYPHEFSGGQRQRIAIARALITRPKLVIADEPLSALDISIQAKIINLLLKLQKEFNLTYLFISHDLRVVEYISNRIVVMYLGRIVETASAEDLYKQPYHPYTQALLSAIPSISADRKKRIILKGDIPSPLNIPSGCCFYLRCRYSQARCKMDKPKLISYSSRQAACHFPLI